MSWKDKYIELKYPSQIKNHETFLGNIRKAQSLKFENIPNKLFKYFNFDDSNYSLDNFTNDIVYLNNPKNFNDPFDCMSYSDPNKLFKESRERMIQGISKVCNIELGDENIDEIIDSKSFSQKIYTLIKGKEIKGFKEEDKEKICEIFEKMLIENENKMCFPFSVVAQETNRIACFSETNESILMWSHYAENHNGFCLEYNFSELGFNDVRALSLYPMCYSENFPDITEYLKEGFNNKDSYNNLIPNYIAMIKSTEWKYEKEWRLIIGAGIFKNPTPYPVPTPKAVYLGVSISENNKEKIIKIAKQKNIKVFQMEMAPDKYVLISKELSI